MAKLINIILIAILVGAFIVPEQSEGFLFKKLFGKALFAKKALLAPKLLMAKKALPLMAMKAKKLIPLAIGAKMLAAKKLIPKALLAKKFLAKKAFIAPKFAVGAPAFRHPVSFAAPAPSFALPAPSFAAPAPSFAVPMPTFSRPLPSFVAPSWGPAPPAPFFGQATKGIKA